MAEAGIGVDIVEISRMKSILEKTPSFARRVFTEEECAYCDASSRPAAHYASRFASREAVLKALGTGFSQGVGRKDVSVTRDNLGKPKAVLSGRALEIAQELGVVEVALSITLTGDLAVANAIAITEDARPKPKEEKVSTKERVAQTFKEARSVLDELEQLQNSALTEHLGDASRDTLGAYMKPVLSTEEVVRLEDIIEREGTSKAELMELAGEFAATEILKLNPDRVLVLVGFGNNGGDGWVAADILSHKGVDVDIVSPVEPDEIPAALARHVARRTAGRDVHVCVGPSRDELEVLIDKADVVVDAIFGTGFHGDLRAPFSIWIPTVNDCADHVVSIDVPSGLNAETGVVDDDCIRAERTVTMITPKIGLYSADGPEYAGDLVCGSLYDRLDEVIDDVDHAAEIVEPGDLVDFFAPLPSNIDKYSRGSVLIVAGSAQYPGAAIMAAKSAARAGAGYVAVATPDACANLIRMALPSIPVFAIPSDSRGSFGAAARMTVCEIAKKYSCVLCGPGMTTSAGAMQVVSGLLELDVPLILDADALNCLSKIAIDGIDSNPEMYRREQPLVMTPHYRELSRLVAGDEVNDLGTAIAAAQKVVWAAGSDNLVVIAKGPTTAICGVERVLLPLSGPASLATAGSGDVLAGILAGTLATMRDEMDRWELLYSYAVALHSYAGFAAATEYGEKSVIATDLIDLIGPAMELAAKDALDDLGIMDEGSDD